MLPDAYIFLRQTANHPAKKIQFPACSTSSCAGMTICFCHSGLDPESRINELDSEMECIPYKPALSAAERDTVLE